MPNAREVAVVNLADKRQTARWTVPSFRANFPTAIDTAGTTIAVVYRSPPRLVLLRADAGRETFGVPTCGDADDVFFDDKRNRIYISCGDGHVDAWERDVAGVRHLASIPTAAGARTSLFVPALDRLFVAARAGLLGITSNARLLVMKPVD